MAIEKFEKDMKIISPLDDYPNDAQGLTSEELKAKFDEGGEALKEYINTVLLPALIARNLGFERSDNVPADTIQEAIENLFDQIRNTAVGTIPNGAVTTEKIAEKSVSLAKLADDAQLVLDGFKRNISTNADDIDDLMIALAQVSVEVEQHIEKANGCFAEHDVRISRREADATNNAYQYAQSALEAEYDGRPMLWHDNNVLTNLLPGPSAVDELTDVYISNGAGLIAFSGTIESKENTAIYKSEANIYKKVASLSELKGFFVVTQIQIMIGASHGVGDGVSLQLRQSGKEIATCTLEYSPPSGTGLFTYNVSDCPRIAPHEGPVEIWAKYSPMIEQTVTLSNAIATVEGSAPSAGWFKKAHGTICGGKLVLAAKYTGSRPVVSYRLNDTEWVTINAMRTIATKAADGSACTAASYEAHFAEYAIDARLDIKFELMNAGTSVYDYCAAVVR